MPKVNTVKSVSVNKKGKRYLRLLGTILYTIYALIVPIPAKYVLILAF